MVLLGFGCSFTSKYEISECYTTPEIYRAATSHAFKVWHRTRHASTHLRSKRQSSFQNFGHTGHAFISIVLHIYTHLLPITHLTP